MALWQVTSTEGGRRAGFADAQLVVYLMTDRTLLPIVFEPVWCDRCRHVTNGERIESAATFDRAWGRRQQPPDDARLCDYDPVVASAAFAAEWGADERFARTYTTLTLSERRRQWRAGRRSAARCLHCGSTGIVPFGPGLTMPDPAGSGELRVHSPLLADYDGLRGTFTPEGWRTVEPPRRWWHRVVRRQ